MDQRNVVVCAAVLQDRSLIPQHDLKLSLGFIVCNGITFHEVATPLLLYPILREWRSPCSFFARLEDDLVPPPAAAIKFLAPGAPLAWPLHRLPATNR